MKVIGITGGIGSGKSTVTNYLRELGYTVVDADGIAREITGDPAVINEIRDLAGERAIADDGKPDRKEIAEIIFSDDELRHKYEKIVTGRTVDKVKDIISSFRSGAFDTKENMLFLDAPLLFETGVNELTDSVWLVSSDEDIRVERVMSRDNISREEILARMRAQMSDEEKRRLSDVIIENNGTVEDLHKILDSII